MGMNFNFHHQHYAKCTKCHKIHKNNQHEPNINLSDEKTSAGFLYTVNNNGNNTKKDINTNTEKVTDKEFNQYGYLYKNQQAYMGKNEIDKANQESQINRNQNISQRHETINVDDYTKIYTPGDTGNINPFEKLKQLQKQRASSEYYYSQEIQKIISEYFTSDYGTNENRWSKNIERNRPIRTHRSQEFEQCGVITTITQLDCGCVQKSKSPIFTPTDTQTHYIHYCTDGKMNGDVEEINLKNSHFPQTYSQDKPLSFNHTQRRPWHETSTDQIVHHKPPKFDLINSKHSFFNPASSTKLLKNTFHRTNNY